MLTGCCCRRWLLGMIVVLLLRGVLTDVDAGVHAVRPGSLIVLVVRSRTGLIVKLPGLETTRKTIMVLYKAREK